MGKICIGVHVHSEPSQLEATLASLNLNTRLPLDLLLLPDGPDELTRVALRNLADIPQLGTPEALGPSACFNRLASASSAELIILLESGAQVGSGWLDFLLAALEADPRNGLAGPSTNHSWNEQGVFSGHGGSLAEIERTSKEAARRFGSQFRTLGPLYSLADFCYAVRREVIEAVGAADEAYGLGPCWEMDYNVRAARAGFQGVWACGSYVYRAPFTARRRQSEVRQFEASKQRYQRKFCGLHLRQLQSSYEAHCRGEVCPYFAPNDLIELKLPLPKITNPEVQVSSSLATGVQAAKDKGPETIQPSPPQPLLQTTLSQISSSNSYPLVSCIMPTGNRVEFARQAITYFQQQDYPARELVIVDDGRESLSEQLPNDPRIRYLQLSPGQSIGVKRNRACEIAQGSIIAQWDDDDWYASNRLSVQIAPLLTNQADITALSAEVFFDLDRWEFWKCSPELHRRLFVSDVHGGTLVYQRRVWQELAHYPDRSLAEDALFLMQTQRRGARLQRLSGAGLFIYLRHAGNSWAFRCGQYLDPGSWQRLPEVPLPAPDRVFYAACARSTCPSSSVVGDSSSAKPLVSCIMPTADRRHFVERAIYYFQRQDYPNRELIIVDDGHDSIENLIPAEGPIRYFRLKDKRTVGAKRNLACQEAKGDVILHWDDDDWMAKNRISYQVENLLNQQADFCGLDKVLYYDLRGGRGWQYKYPAGNRACVVGNTLCYSKKLWQKNPFLDINVGEDARFLWSNPSAKIVTLSDNTFYVAFIHTSNISPKQTSHSWWHSYPALQIENLIGEDWSFYIQLTGI